jgi:hypothetical protein
MIKPTRQSEGLPRLEELVHHNAHFFRAELEGATSGASAEAGAASRPETPEFAKGGVTLDLDGHATGTFHLGLGTRTRIKYERKQIGT